VTVRTRPRPPASAWAALAAAITIDIAGVFLLAAADGFRHPVLVAAAVVAFAVEVWAFSRALRSVETSVAYALYGVGTAAVAVISITALGERATPVKVAGLAMVVVGAVLLSQGEAKSPRADRDTVQRSPETPRRPR
jgi:multidrug transporter EmrE-like cation transporter